MTQAYTFGAETHLGGGDTSAFVVSLAAIAQTLSTSLAVQPLGKAHEGSDHTVMIAVIHCRLHAKTQRAGKVVSAII